MGKRLYVGNLPYDADEAGLRELFSQDGRVVERVHIVLDRETQKPRGFAFVEMGSEEQAKAAQASLDGSMFGMRQLRISEAEDRRPPGPGGPGGGGGGPRGPRPDRPPMGRPSSGPRPAPGGGGGPGGGGPGGGAGPGGGGGWSGDDRSSRFGPDSKPRRERDKDYGKKTKRRSDDDGDHGGRRRGGRFDDDDDGDYE